MSSDKGFSSIDLVGQCLLDTERTEAFYNAIKRAMRPGMLVLDAGTGSGILAIYAALAGAKKVYAVELDPFIANVARSNIAANKLEDKITVIQADARTLKLPAETKIDMLLMEMLTTGMIDEFQISAIAHLSRSKYISPDTIFIPREQQSFISLGSADFNFANATMPMVLHVWDIHVKKSRFNPITKKALYDSYGFNANKALDLDAIVEFRAMADGIVNSALLESKSILDNECVLGETQALNGKVMIPLEPKIVHHGDLIPLRIQYKYGDGFENLKINLLR